MKLSITIDQQRSCIDIHAVHLDVVDYEQRLRLQTGVQTWRSTKARLVLVKAISMKNTSIRWDLINRLQTFRKCEKGHSPPPP